MKFKIRTDGSVVAVYNDVLPKLQLGSMHVVRASNVEFDPGPQDWVAVDHSGTEIARGKDRTEVIKEEVRVIERQISENKFPI
jgi:hypothetical protein